MSQKQLASRVGVSHVTISTWEAGTNKPKTESFVSLAAGLDLPLDELWVTLGDKGLDNDAFVNMVKQTYLTLNDEKRRELLNLLISLGVGAQNQNHDESSDLEKT